MALITLPSGFDASQFRITLVRPSDRPIEFFGGGEVYIEYPIDSFWMASFPLVTKTQSDARPWNAFLAQVSKLSNTFEITPPGWSNGAGYTNSNPLVAGGSQSGTSLNVDGLPAATDIAVAGDYMEVNGEFKIITADVTSDGGGGATISFEPDLKESPSDNATVDVKTPKVTMRLAEPRVEWITKPPTFYNHTITCVEARPAT